MTESIAVIDIGSNSVRLVVYDSLKRVPMSLFNEKVLCGLARGLEKTGKLNPAGVELAKATLARFITISFAMNVKALHIIATAAVRDAVDGREFVESIEREYPVKVRIFSGEEEAGFAGLGISASMPGAKGIVADLGGGSLELARIDGEKVKDCQSFPIGMLRLLGLSADDGGNMKKAKGIIERYFDKLPIFEKVKGQRFYAVGGSFRSLAKIHIALTHYPLRILHHYTVSASEFLSVARNVAHMSTGSLERVAGISGKRSETLPYAALIAEQILTYAKPDKVIFSANGIREGFLFDQLGEKEREEDPLISSCLDMAKGPSEYPEYAYELCDWMGPLFPDENKAGRRLRLAACILSGLARFEHTEYRAEIAYKRFIDASVTGISHMDRLFIATSLFHRYKTSPDTAVIGAVGTLLEDDVVKMARIVGLAMRLGHNICASMPGVISGTTLAICGSDLCLEFSASSNRLMGEAVQKRLEKLAQAMGLKAKVYTFPEK